MVTIFDHKPVRMVCPHCSSSINTKTEEEPGVLAWISAGVLCLFRCSKMTSRTDLSPQRTLCLPFPTFYLARCWSYHQVTVGRKVT